MLRLEQWVFAQTHHVGVYQVVALAQRFTELGVGAQGKDATVNVHRRVIFDGAAVRGGDFVVGVAVGLQHFDGGAQQGCAFAVVQGAQRRAAGVAGKGKACGQVQTGGVHPHQGRAQDRIHQRAARARAVRPLAAKVVRKKFGHGAVF